MLILFKSQILIRFIKMSSVNIENSSVKAKIASIRVFIDAILALNILII